jgi:hypothetical protein
VLFEIDPPALSLAPGEVKSVLVRATGGEWSAATNLSIQFDPAIAAVVAVRPILSGAGAGDATVSGGRVVLQLPGGIDLTESRPVAEITLRAMGAGRTKLAFERNVSGSAVSTTDAAIEVRSQ